MHVDLEQRLVSWVADPQLGSPLFAMLPPEIRQEIFSLALAPLDMLPNWCYKLERVESCGDPPDFCIRFNHDGDQGVLEEIRARKPDPRHYQDVSKTNGSYAGQSRFPLDTGPCLHHKYLSPTLLATCRSVFTEARLLIFGSERGFWNFSAHGPPPRVQESRREDLFSDVPGISRQYTTVGYWSWQRVEWERRFPRLNFSQNLRDYHKFLAKEPDCWPWMRITTKRFPWSKLEHLRFFTTHKDGWNGIAQSRAEFYHTWHPLLKDQRSPSSKSTYADNMALAAERYFAQKMPESTANDVQLPNVPGRPGWMHHTADRYPIGSWARDFVNLPRIKSLTMNFHCPENQRVRYESMVRFAAETWRFPLNPRHAGYHYLSAEGNEIERITWRGHVGHWVVTWTRRKYNGPELYPYKSLVEVDERDYQEHGDSDLEEDEKVDWEAFGIESPPENEQGRPRKKVYK